MIFLHFCKATNTHGVSGNLCIWKRVGPKMDSPPPWHPTNTFLDSDWFPFSTTLCFVLWTIVLSILIFYHLFHGPVISLPVFHVVTYLKQNLCIPHSPEGLCLSRWLCEQVCKAGSVFNEPLLCRLYKIVHWKLMNDSLPEDSLHELTDVWCQADRPVVCTKIVLPFLKIKGNICIFPI